MVRLQEAGTDFLGSHPTAKTYMIHKHALGTVTGLSNAVVHTSVIEVEWDSAGISVEGQQIAVETPALRNISTEVHPSDFVTVWVDGSGSKYAARRRQFPLIVGCVNGCGAHIRTSVVESFTLRTHGMI